MEFPSNRYPDLGDEKRGGRVPGWDREVATSGSKQWASHPELEPPMQENARFTIQNLAKAQDVMFSYTYAISHLFSNTCEALFRKPHGINHLSKKEIGKLHVFDFEHRDRPL